MAFSESVCSKAKLDFTHEIFARHSADVAFQDETDDDGVPATAGQACLTSFAGHLETYGRFKVFENELGHQGSCVLEGECSLSCKDCQNSRKLGRG